MTKNEAMSVLQEAQKEPRVQAEIGRCKGYYQVKLLLCGRELRMTVGSMLEWRSVRDLWRDL